MAIGVDDAAFAETQGDVAFPEHQIAPVEVCRRDLSAQGLLLVGVAWAGQAAGEQRLLDQARAVQAQAVPAAPEVGRADEAFGGYSRPMIERVAGVPMTR